MLFTLLRRFLLYILRKEMFLFLPDTKLLRFLYDLMFFYRNFGYNYLKVLHSFSVVVLVMKYR